jgi:hypothetical protein
MRICRNTSHKRQRKLGEAFGSPTTYLFSFIKRCAPYLGRYLTHTRTPRRRLKFSCSPPLCFALDPCFFRDDLSDETIHTYEGNRAKVINIILGPKENPAFDFTIDIHATGSGCCGKLLSRKTGLPPTRPSYSPML